MWNRRTQALGAGLLASAALAVAAQPPAPHDAVADAQTPREAPSVRPEQKLSAHDRSGVFDPAKARPNSSTVEAQPDRGSIPGFDFYRDPLNAKRPMQTAN